MLGIRTARGARHQDFVNHAPLAFSNASSSAAAARKRAGMRVLLIEDDSATAQSIELMLKSESFNVYTTDLGEEGVDLGKIYDYDIILLDLNLPDMSGFEVLRSLRVSKVPTPILILSGLAAIEDKVNGLGFGADDYMTCLLYTSDAADDLLCVDLGGRRIIKQKQ